MYRTVTVALLLPLPLSACEYTVRDVAFVELGDKPYRLIAPSSTIADLFVDTNVTVKVPIGEGPGGPVLESPDGRRLGIPFGELHTVADSPKRRAILKACVEAHSAIVLADGDDESRKIAEAAIKEINGTLQFLPKPIENPPRLIEIAPGEEPVLRWALGIEGEGPKFAVVVGRGRRVGPVMEPDREKLVATLGIVGQDCECDLDRSMMHGTMFPHVWDERMETKATKLLGFDPGNPLVQAEISRILAKGPGAKPEGAPATGRLGVYEEFDLDGPTEPDEPVETEPPKATPSAPVGETPESRPADSQPTSPTTPVIWVLGGLLAVAVIGGVVFLLGRKGN